MITLFGIFYFVFIINVKHVDTVIRSSETQQRVIEGLDVTSNEYSFVIILSAFFYFDVYRLCTGFMITEEWGLTAGHCECRRCYAWYGNFTESPILTELFTPVDKIIKHPSYRILTLNKGRTDLLVDNDISLFHVYQKMHLKSYARLLSVDRATIIGLPVTYIGGGISSLKNSIEDSFKPLQYGEGAIINCDEEMRRISKYALCITPKCSKRMSRPWYGDSGGPLICDGKIVGLCSFGIESDVLARTSFTPISPYIDWIYEVIIR